MRGRLHALAAERRWFEYRRLFVLLRREDEPSGKNPIYLLYREEGLTVRERGSIPSICNHAGSDPYPSGVGRLDGLGSAVMLYA